MKWYHAIVTHRLHGTELHRSQGHSLTQVEEHYRKDEYVSAVLSVHRGPYTDMTLTPHQVGLLSQHIFRALHDFPSQPVDRSDKALGTDGPMMEDWEEALKLAVDADEELPEYVDMPEFLTEILIHYYGDYLDAARSAGDTNEIPPGTGVAAD